MRRTLAVSLCFATAVGASQEGVLPLASFTVESPGIGESGPVVVSGRQNQTGFEVLEVNAFGRTFKLTAP